MTTTKLEMKVVSMSILSSIRSSNTKGERVLAVLLLLVLNIGQPLGAFAAHNEKIASKRPFQLKVSVDELPQLSRDEVGVDSRNTSPVSKKSSSPLVGEIELPGNIDELGSSQQIGFAPPVTGLPKLETPQPTNEDGALYKQDALAPKEDADGGNGSMREFGVDWSSWVSKLADRWFFALTKMEQQSGLQFHTVRPALIHFTCYANGQIDNIYVKQSSGVPIYDQMQMQALLRIMPLHPFPRGTQRTTFTLVQGWESHPRQPGEEDFCPGSFGKATPMEIVRQWMSWR